MAIMPSRTASWVALVAMVVISPWYLVTSFSMRPPSVSDSSPAIANPITLWIYRDFMTLAGVCGRAKRRIGTSWLRLSGVGVVLTCSQWRALSASLRRSFTTGSTGQKLSTYRENSTVLSTNTNRPCRGGGGGGGGRDLVFEALHDGVGGHALGAPVRRLVVRVHDLIDRMVVIGAWD